MSLVSLPKMDQDIRWKQRFQNFENAILYLREALTNKHHSDLEKAGVIQVYEFTFELAWKTIKDYLAAQGVLAKIPKDVIKEAFTYDLIKNGDTWMDMLEKRNLMSHTYNEKNADTAYQLIIADYQKELLEVYETLKKQP